MHIVLGSLLTVSLLVGPPGAWAVPSPAARCLAAKTLAAGSEARTVIACAQRSLATGTDTDAGCLAKAASRREAAFDAAEARGGCAQTGDSAAIGAEIVALHDAVLAALRPGGPAASRCTAAQLAIASRTVAKIAQAYARDDRSPDAARRVASIAAAYAQLDGAFARAAARGDCLSTTDAGETRAILGQGIARMRATLLPTCGDGVRAGAESCDGADLGSCPQACDPDCTCAPPPPVCGNGVIEQGEDCDGGTICRNRPVGEYGCYAPPADDACQCCATTAPCYVRGYGTATPVETPCCTGTCDIPGPEAGPNVIVHCSDVPPATCPCWSSATIDATFPPGYFTTDGRGGTTCFAADDVFGVGAADFCTLPSPIGNPPAMLTRAGVAVLSFYTCALFTDLDPEDSGICNGPPLLTSGLSSRQAAACLTEMTSSQAYQSACP